MSSLVDRVPRLRDKGNTHAAGNAYSVANVVAELAECFEQYLLGEMNAKVQLQDGGGRGPQEGQGRKRPRAETSSRTPPRGCSSIPSPTSRCRNCTGRSRRRGRAMPGRNSSADKRLQGRCQGC